MSKKGSRTIWKFEFEVSGEVEIEMPLGAEILHVEAQVRQPCLWAMVTQPMATKARKFRIFGTGHPIDNDLKLRFVGTFQMAGGALVWHMFEVTS